jgi:cbb3-type cytochrome oxidase subunit 3
MNVARAAIVFGVTRVSYESLYLAVVSILVLVVVGLLILMLYHAVRAKRKHKVVLKEVNEAQEALRRGFAVLRRDIEREIEMLKRDRVSKDPTQEERSREEELRRDLKDIEDRIGREIWDIEKLEMSPS